MGVLIEQIENGPVGSFQRVRAGYLDKLRSLRRPLVVGSLFQCQTHNIVRLRHGLDSCPQGVAPLLSHLAVSIHPFCRNRRGLSGAERGCFKVLRELLAAAFTRFVASNPACTRFVATSHPFRRNRPPALSQRRTRFVVIMGDRPLILLSDSCSEFKKYR